MKISKKFFGGKFKPTKLLLLSHTQKHKTLGLSDDAIDCLYIQILPKISLSVTSACPLRAPGSLGASKSAVIDGSMAQGL